MRPEAFAPVDLRPRLLADLLGIPSARAAARAPYLRLALEMAEITTTLRLAHYLAQIGHETGLLVYRREVWGPTPAQRLYERDPAAPWRRSGHREGGVHPLRVVAGEVADQDVAPRVEVHG